MKQRKGTIPNWFEKQKLIVKCIVFFPIFIFFLIDLIAIDVLYLSTGKVSLFTYFLFLGIGCITREEFFFSKKN